MKTMVLAGVALMMLSGVAMAAATATPLTGGPPPTADQKARFLKICLANSGGNSTLCTCKAAEVSKLIDGDFMTLVLASMSGKTLPVEDSRNYAVYISQSNKICAPGM